MDCIVDSLSLTNFASLLLPPLLFVAHQHCKFKYTHFFWLGLLSLLMILLGLIFIFHNCSCLSQPSKIEPRDYGTCTRVRKLEISKDTCCSTEEGAIEHVRTTQYCDAVDLYLYRGKSYERECEKSIPSISELHGSANESVWQLWHQSPAMKTPTNHESSLCRIRYNPTSTSIIKSSTLLT